MSAAKFVQPLSEGQRADLEKLHRSGRTYRQRLRAQAILLSADGFKLPQIRQILKVRRDTLSHWIDDWHAEGIPGLSEAARSGRPRKIQEHHKQQLQPLLDQPQPNLRAQVQASLEKGG
jgi:transposase